MTPPEDTQRVNMGERVVLAEAVRAVLRKPAPVGLTDSDTIPEQRLPVPTEPSAAPKPMDDWRAKEFEAAIMKRMAEVESRLDKLGTLVDATAVVALLEQVAHVWSRASDPSKRRLVVNLFVNAFDPSSYQEGMTQALLDVVSKLDYGDVWHLHKWRAQTRSFCRFFPWREPTELAHYHAERLRKAHLVVKDQYESDETARVLPTELGKRLLALVDPVDDKNVDA